MTNPNLWAFLSVLVTSVTTIVLAYMNNRKANSIIQKVDANTATTETVHTIVNSRYDALVEQLQSKQAEIDQLKALASAVLPQSTAGG